MLARSGAGLACSSWLVWANVASSTNGSDCLLPWDRCVLELGILRLLAPDLLGGWTTLLRTLLESSTASIAGSRSFRRCARAGNDVYCDDLRGSLATL